MKLLVFCGLISLESKQAIVDQFVGRNTINVNSSAAGNDITQLNECLLELQQVKAASEHQSQVGLYFYDGDIEEFNSTPIMCDNYHIISFYSSPEFSVLSSQALDEWFSHSNAILNLHLSSLPNSSLVNQADLTEYADQFLTLLANVSGLNLEALNLVAKPTDLLEITQIIQVFNNLSNQPLLQQLYEQLEGSTDIVKFEFGQSVNSRQEYWFEQLSTIATANEQRVRQLEANQQDLQHQLDSFDKQQNLLNSENELALLQISQLQEELEQGHIENARHSVDPKTLLEKKEQLFATEKATLVEQLVLLESQQTTLNSENELALLQISQLQEELEQVHIESARDKVTFEQKEQQLTAEKASHDEQLVLLNTQQTTFNDENKLALLQINQLQQELEASNLNYEKLQKQFNEKNKELLQLKNGSYEKMSNSISVEEYNANSKEHQARIQQLELKVIDLEAENELGLLQINQLQEELEFYYIKHQQSQIWNPFELKSVDVPSHLQSSLVLLAL